MEKKKQTMLLESSSTSRNLLNILKKELMKNISC